MTSLDDARALELIDAGWSDRAVGRELGVDHRRVARVRAREGRAVWTAPVPEHGTPARGRRGCGCAACREAVAVAKAAEYARSGRPTGVGVMDEASRARTEARRRVDLERTARDATEAGRPWTEAELAVALDYAHSATRAAEILGRSKSAVEHQRRKRAGEATASGPLPRGRRATRK